MMLSIGKTTRMELMSQKAYNRKTTLPPKFLVPSNRMPNTGLISRVTGSTITWPLLLLSIKPGFSLILTTILSVLLLILKMLQTILLRRMHSSKTTLLRTFTSHNTMSTCSSIILQILRLNLFRSKIKWQKKRFLPKQKRQSPLQRQKTQRSRRHQNQRRQKTRPTDSILMRCDQSLNK